MMRLIIVILVCIFSFGFAQAQQPANIKSPQFDESFEKILELSHNQQQKVLLLKQALENRRHSIQEKLKAIDNQINQEIKNTLKDDRRLAALLSQKQQLLGLMVKHHALFRQQYYKLLTPAQKKLFDQNMKQSRPAIQTQHI